MLEVGFQIQSLPLRGVPRFHCPMPCSFLDPGCQPHLQIRQAAYFLPDEGTAQEDAASDHTLFPLCGHVFVAEEEWTWKSRLVPW